MAQPLTCPQCEKENVLRSPATSFTDRLASALFISPFRCQLCSHRFRAFRVGRRYSRGLLDRREHRRIPVRLSLAFSGGRIRGSGTVLDISIGGCLIESDAMVRVNDIFYLRFSLLEGGPPLEVAAIVRSVRAKRLGCKFLRAAREDKRLLEFLRAQAGDTQGPTP